MTPPTRDSDPTEARLATQASRRAETAGEWAEAARHRDRALAADPSDPAAALLAGHARRRLGDEAEAARRYEAARAAAPADAAPLLHLGHALRCLGRLAEAERAYGLAAALDPGWGEPAAARAALLAERAGRDALPAPGPPPPEVMPAGPPEPASLPPLAVPAAPVLDGPPRLAYDVTDLLLHFDHARTPTGIQRVQASVVSAALRSAPGGRDLLSYDGARAAWRAVPAEDLAALLDLSATGSEVEDPEWVAARDGLRRRLAAAPDHAFPPGAVLANLGNAWGVAEYFRGLRGAQRASGLRYVPFLHDCVPLLLPEHCVRTLVEDYARWFSALALHAHALLCNSESTRDDAERHLDAFLPGLCLPSAVARLDGDPRGAAPDPAALAALPAPRPGEPYVLFVATLESRKDHLTVFRAWLTLLRRHGAERVPRLVCVGGQGWHAEAALGLLANSPELAERVSLLRGVSDPALAALYAGCLFTLYNSHHEGWGLPVTESLAWGRLPVVPAHSGLLESGGEAALYVAPQDEGALVSAVERLLRPGGLAAAEARVQRARLRPWAEVEAGIAAFLDEVGRRPPSPPEARAAPPLGTLLSLSRDRSGRPDLLAAQGEALRDGPGWHAPEDWGCWSDGRARLRWPLSGAAGPLRLHLRLRAPPAGGEVAVSLRLDGVLARRGVLSPAGGTDFATALSFQALPGTAAAELDLESDSSVPEGDRRRLGVGVLGALLCREDDLLARLGFLESQRLREPAAA